MWGGESACTLSELLKMFDAQLVSARYLGGMSIKHLQESTLQTVENSWKASPKPFNNSDFEVEVGIVLIIYTRKSGFRDVGSQPQKISPPSVKHHHSETLWILTTIDGWFIKHCGDVRSVCFEIPIRRLIVSGSSPALDANVDDQTIIHRSQKTILTLPGYFLWATYPSTTKHRDIRYIERCKFAAVHGTTPDPVSCQSLSKRGVNLRYSSPTGKCSPSVGKV
ncbi:hypothetical protein B0J14DRAFT_16444 [Halenospora varia]|nr:hypothetical protein B0J14DRAFT_16444 [Halenospora varia]